jgi:hypothetical protein
VNETKVTASIAIVAGDDGTLLPRGLVENGTVIAVISFRMLRPQQHRSLGHGGLQKVGPES